MSARAGVRIHNQSQREIALRGGKPDYIDVRAEKAMMQIAKNNDTLDKSGVSLEELAKRTLSEKREKMKKHG